MTRVLVIALLVWLLPGASPAQSGAAESISQGVQAYARAQGLTDRSARAAAFTRAEQLFNDAALRGAGNADVFANAGTAALQAERLGPAILAFRRALSLDPDHARSRRNLLHARSLLPAWVPRPPEESLLDTFFFWHRALSAAERAGIGALCFALAALAFAVALARRSRLARGLAVLPVMAWLGLTLSLVMEATSSGEQEAVLTPDETLARASDSANAPTRFPEPLPGGTEVTVLESRTRWARIRLANDLDAWVNLAAVQRISASPE